VSSLSESREASDASSASLSPGMKRLMSVESSTFATAHAVSAASEARNSQRIARSLIASGQRAREDPRELLVAEGAVAAHLLEPGGGAVAARFDELHPVECASASCVRRAR